MNYCLTRLTQLQLVVMSSIASMRYSYREFMVMGERALGSEPSSKYLPRIKRKKYDVNITFNQAYYW